MPKTMTTLKYMIDNITWVGVELIPNTLTTNEFTICITQLTTSINSCNVLAC